jgi:hypothetical protein
MALPRQVESAGRFLGPTLSGTEPLPLRFPLLQFFLRDAENLADSVVESLSFRVAGYAWRRGWFHSSSDALRVAYIVTLGLPVAGC